MDYEKKYKEALDWIRDLYPTMEGAIKEDAEHYFPELKEIKDERIISAIKEAVNYYWADDSQAKTDILAWLEKQRANIDKANKEYWRGYHEGKQEIIDKYLELKDSEDKAISKDLMWCLTHSGVKPDEPINPHVNTITKDAIAWLKKHGKKHTWSEEDLWMIDALCSIFEVNYFKDYYKTVPKGNITKEAIGSYEIIRWLKSLKDKFK